VSQLAVRWPWSTSDSVDNTWLAAAFTARTKARYAFDTTPFGMEKLKWCGYMFIRFDMIHERDRHTDGRTDRHRMTA